jgi:hypothetical protein
MTLDVLIPIFVRKQYKKALNAFDEIVSGTREIVRPNLDKPEPNRKCVTWHYGNTHIYT